jgi:FeS assembly SUF system regulator
MIKLSKLTDYGFVLLTRFADSSTENWHTARDLADETGLPLPTVSKLLKVFSRGGILAAHRGVHGGYNLSRPADHITASDIIEVIDGPIAITDCVCDGHSEPCAIEDHCPTKPHWVQITNKIRAALDQVTLAELAAPVKNNQVSATVDDSRCRGGLCNSMPGEPCSCGDHARPTLGDKLI